MFLELAGDGTELAQCFVAEPGVKEHELAAPAAPTTETRHQWREFFHF